jgi:hypothetical protein
MSTADSGTTYSAGIIFKERSLSFKIKSGDLESVTEAASKLSEATGIRVAGTKEFTEACQGYVSASKLLG